MNESDHKTIRERYYELCRAIWHHNDAYFVRNDPEISDEQYDQLMTELKAWEKRYPDEIIPGSPTRSIGEKPSGRFAVHAHTWPMLSYDKVFSLDEFHSFHDSCVSSTRKDPLYYVDVKVDGCAVALWYYEGVLTKGLTRGDGIYGDLITDNILRVHGVPKRLPENVSCEIRGEVYMPLATLEKINLERIKSHKSVFANTRNCTAGTLRSLDPTVVAQRNLVFCGYSLSLAEVQTVTQMMQKLTCWGIAIPSPFVSNTTFDGAKSFIKNMEDKRDQLDFKIDGIVIKLESCSDHLRLGSTGQYYRWGVAFKYPAKRCYTKVRKIEANIGRIGHVTPLAILDPVVLDGSVISRATLHNFFELQKKDIREGDWIVIEKSGDIIPYIVEPDLTRRANDSVPFAKPKHCPSCTTKLAEEGAFLVCKGEHCSGKMIRSLLHFAREMNIDGLGNNTVEKLVFLGKLRDWEDFYKLQLCDFEELDHMGVVLAKKLLISIEKSKKASFASFLVALGIPHLGKQGAIALAKRYDSWNVLRSQSIKDLECISGFGKKSACSIYLALQSIEERVQKLFGQGIVLFGSAQPMGSSIFHGLHFAITGKFIRSSREDLERVIRDLGGTVSNSVSKKTNYILAGKDPGHKLVKAQSLQISVVDESWLFSNLEKAF